MTQQPKTGQLGQSMQVSGQPMARTTPTPITQGALKEEKVSKKDDEKKEEEAELENLRSQKLLNSKDNNKSIVIVQFSFFALIFIAYFIADIVVEMQYLDNVDRVYSHLRLVSMRPSQIKYTVYFTVEEVVTGLQQLENGTDNRAKFSALVYENERDIFTSLKETYPAQFDDYQSRFQAFNYENLCAQHFTSCKCTTTTSTSQRTSA